MQIVEETSGCSPRMTGAAGALQKAEQWLWQSPSRQRPRCSWSRKSSCFSPASRPATCSAPPIWSDELAGILFLWLAMLGSVIAFQRGEHMRMTASSARSSRRAARFLDVLAIAAPLAFLVLRGASGLRVRVRRGLRHDPGARNLEFLARRRASGRYRADAADCRAAPGCRPAICGWSPAPSASSPRLARLFMLLGPVLMPLGKLNLLIFFVGLVGGDGVRRRADRLRVRPRDLRLHHADHQHAGDRRGRPHGRGHEPPHPAGGAAVRLPRPASSK